MTANLDDMPNPFCFAASPSRLGASHNTGERDPSVMPDCREGEDFLPGLQIGDAGQQLDAVRFMHEIMPPGCENALADYLPVHRPMFLIGTPPNPHPDTSRFLDLYDGLRMNSRWPS